MVTPRAMTGWRGILNFLVRSHFHTLIRNRPNAEKSINRKLTFTEYVRIKTRKLKALIAPVEGKLEFQLVDCLRLTSTLFYQQLHLFQIVLQINFNANRLKRTNVPLWD